MERLPAEVRVPSGRLRIRRWVAADEPALSSAIAASAEHLRPWMVWVKDEPLPPAARLALIQSWDEAWERGDEAVYGIFRAGDDAVEVVVAGGCGLHRRTDRRPDVVEIGYWVHADHIRQGIATEASEALTSAAFELAKTTIVEIKHEVGNEASGRVPARLGYTFVNTIIDGETVDGTPRELACWAVTRDAWLRRTAGADFGYAKGS
jgi:ribosomal-protein-serine acetyltransferase